MPPLSLGLALSENRPDDKEGRFFFSMEQVRAQKKKQKQARKKKRKRR
jgi:hypothetical protein